MYGYELNHKEGWVPKNWCSQTVVLEKTPESLLACKEIKPANPRGDQPWVFIGRTDAGAEAPILWSPYAKRQLTGKDPDAGKYWGGGSRGWDGRMASPTQWTWVWTSSRRYWRTGKPGVLQFVESQRVGPQLATEHNSIPGIQRLTAETTRPSRKSGKLAGDIHTSEVPARPLLPARMTALPSPQQTDLSDQIRATPTVPSFWKIWVPWNLGKNPSQIQPQGPMDSCSPHSWTDKEWMNTEKSIESFSH